MKQSSIFIPTTSEVSPEGKSFNMLFRAGFICENGNNGYSYLPLGKKVLRKIETIVREEIEAVGAIEISLSSLQNTDLLEQSSRINYFKDKMMYLVGQDKQKVVLAPSHEEVVTSLVRDEIKSYEKLPLVFYQIQTKYHIENNSNYPLNRNRETVLNSVYSLHADLDSLKTTYEQIGKAYSNILNRLGLNHLVVKGDSGIAGGHSEEFVIPIEKGDTIIVTSDKSSYASTIDVANVHHDYETQHVSMKELEKVNTSNVKTIRDLCLQFNILQTQYIKTHVYKNDDEIIVILVRGDHQVNKVKLKNILHSTNVQLADENEVIEILGCHPNSIGPIKLPVDIKVIADYAIQAIRNGVAGANEEGFHYLNVNPERDFAINSYEDIRYIQEGETSPDGIGKVHFTRGFSIGQMNNVGPYYSEKFNATILDENGDQVPIMLGSFQLGVSPLLSMLAENNQDELGFVWPKQLSPFDIHLIPVNRDDELQWNLSNDLYTILTSYRFDVLFDDRSINSQIKFEESDIIGIPVRVTIGEKASEGIVEVKFRSNGDTFEWAKEELVDRLNEFFRADLYS